MLPTPPRRRFLPALTSAQLAQIDRESAIVVLPVASVEQHGPHLPLYTDSLTTETVLAGAIDLLGDGLNVWSLPLLAYGKSTEHSHFPGTLALSTETFARVLKEIAGGLHRSEFTRLAILNGHGGNVAPLESTARDIRAELGMMVFVVGTGLTAYLPDGLIDGTELQWGLHAGELETSVVLATAPDCVDLERLRGRQPAVAQTYRLVGPTKGRVTVAWLADDLGKEGVIGDPSGATADKGRIALDGAMRFVAEALEEIAAFRFEPR